MIPRYCDDPRIAQIHADQARAYMLDHGWNQQPFPRPQLWVFGGRTDDDGQLVVQVLPSSEHLHDFQMRLEELVHALSVIEGRPMAEVLTEMMSYPVVQAGESNGATCPPSPKRPASRSRRRAEK